MDFELASILLENKRHNNHKKTQFFNIPQCSKNLYLT